MCRSHPAWEVGATAPPWGASGIPRVPRLGALESAVLRRCCAEATPAGCEVSRRAPACAPCSRLASSRGCVPVSARLCTYVFCSGHPPCMCFVRVLHDSMCACAYHVLMCVSCTRECVSTHLGICLSGLLVPTFVQVCTCVHV